MNHDFCTNPDCGCVQQSALSRARERIELLESTASELLLALSDRAIDLPEMEALAGVMEER